MRPPSPSLLLILLSLPLTLTTQPYYQNLIPRDELPSLNNGLTRQRIGSNLARPNINSDDFQNVDPNPGLLGSGNSNTSPASESESQGRSRPGSGVAGSSSDGNSSRDGVFVTGETGVDPAARGNTKPAIAGLDPLSVPIAKEHGFNVVNASCADGGGVKSVWSVPNIYTAKQLTTGLCVGKGSFVIDMLCSSTPVRKDLYIKALDALSKYVVYYQSKNGGDSARSVYFQDLNLQHFCGWDEDKYGSSREGAKGECVDVNLRPFVTTMGDLGFSDVEAWGQVVEMMKAMMPLEKPVQCNYGIRNQRSFVGDVMALGCIVTVDAETYSKVNSAPPDCPGID